MSQNNMVWPSGHQCHDVIELGDMLLTLELRGRRMTYDTSSLHRCSDLCVGLDDGQEASPRQHPEA
ncbi:hypothetical protein JOB18_037599 [Solea senegalensis]|uniref:Uncharacterized protein n=1 Tax=Solea senegalensis TaxID=28829 RepID=A0AAV6Q0P5_SOLSE|nr:hypothetical protein JOB18_037599 [Solea senegalensis]